MSKFGISVALLTPVEETGAIDLAALAAHAMKMMQSGVAGVTLFGTTGEGASMDGASRAAGVKALLEAGIPAEKVTLGICETAAQDAANEIESASRLGITQFLLMPPCYFKNCADDGLFDWHMQLLNATPSSAKIILYHIPQASGVGLSVPLVGRLAAAAPERIIAIKDSSGSWANAEALLKQGALPVLIGDERLMHRAVPLGASGAICGMANLYPERMIRLFETGEEDKALSDEVTEIVSVPVVPALKAILAERSGEPGWNRLRAPLTPLSATDRAKVLAAVAEVA